MQQRLSKNTPTKNFGALPLVENFDNNRQFSAIVKSDIRSRPASDAEKNSTAERRFNCSQTNDSQKEQNYKYHNNRAFPLVKCIPRNAYRIGW